MSHIMTVVVDTYGSGAPIIVLQPRALCISCMLLLRARKKNNQRIQFYKMLFLNISLFCRPRNAWACQSIISIGSEMYCIIILESDEKIHQELLR